MFPSGLTGMQKLEGGFVILGNEARIIRFLVVLRNKATNFRFPLAGLMRRRGFAFRSRSLSVFVLPQFRRC